MMSETWKEAYFETLGVNSLPTASAMWDKGLYLSQDQAKMYSAEAKHIPSASCTRCPQYHVVFLLKYKECSWSPCCPSTLYWGATVCKECWKLTWPFVSVRSNDRGRYSVCTRCHRNPTLLFMGTPALNQRLNLYLGIDNAVLHITPFQYTRIGWLFDEWLRSLEHNFSAHIEMFMANFRSGERK